MLVLLLVASSASTGTVEQEQATTTGSKESCFVYTYAVYFEGLWLVTSFQWISHMKPTTSSTTVLVVVVSAVFQS